MRLWRASAAPRATHDAHVAEPRITIACGPRHPRLHSPRSDRSFSGGPCQHLDELLQAPLARLRALGVVEAIEDRVAVLGVERGKVLRRHRVGVEGAL